MMLVLYYTEKSEAAIKWLEIKKKYIYKLAAHGVGRVVGALGFGAGFVRSMRY